MNKSVEALFLVSAQNIRFGVVPIFSTKNGQNWANFRKFHSIFMNCSEFKSPIQVQYTSFARLDVFNLNYTLTIRLHTIQDLSGPSKNTNRLITLCSVKHKLIKWCPGSCFDTLANSITHFTSIKCWKDFFSICTTSLIHDCPLVFDVRSKF